MVKNSRTEAKVVPLTRSGSSRKAINDEHVVHNSSDRPIMRAEYVTVPQEEDQFVFSWHNLTAYARVKEKQWRRYVPRRQPPAFEKVLNDVSGSIASGKMMAVLGDCHSGKSLLLKCLYGWKFRKVRIEGYQLINGAEITDNIRRTFAYIPNDDVFFGSLTVKEHLMYQVMFLMDYSASMQMKKEHVNQIISELDLKHCQDNVIGIHGRLKGLCAGDRKKLSFATQLLIPVNVMLCEFPTMNMDAVMAANVISVLKNLVSKNRIAICTLERPTSAVYSMFTHVLVLAEGHVVFTGYKEDALRFFKSIEYPCPLHYNPADHFVETIHKGGTDGIIDIKEICDRFGRSQYALQCAMENVEQLSSENLPGQSQEMDSEFIKRNIPWWAEVWILFLRTHHCMMREPVLTTIHLLQALFSAVMLSFIFWGSTMNQAKIASANSILFLMLVNMTYQSLLSAVIFFCTDLPVLRKDKFFNYYGTGRLLVVRAFVLFEVILIVPILFTTIVYWSCGLHKKPAPFFICLAMMCLVSNISFAFGSMIACLCGKLSSAVAVSAFTSFPLMMFGGYYVQKRAMNMWFRWLRYTSWFWYSYEILIINQWADLTGISCDYKDKKLCINEGKQVIQTLGFYEENLMVDVIILFGFLIMYKLVTFIILTIRMEFIWKSASFWK